MKEPENSGKREDSAPNTPRRASSSSVTGKGRRPSAVPFLSFVALAAAIITVGYTSYRRYVRNFGLEVSLELTSIADLKVSQIERWRKERLRDMSHLDQNPMLPDLVRRSLQDPADPEARRFLRTWLEKYKAGGEYDQIHVLDRQGKAGLSVPEEIPPVSSAVVRRLPDLFQSGRSEILDFYKDDTESRAVLSLLIPIRNENPQPAVVGVLALRIDPEIYLYPFIQRWPRPSQTAETLIVRRDGDEVLFLNELRFQKNTALNLRIPLREQTIAGQAVGGREGIVRGLDYRRIPVIGNLRRIPDSPWFMIARIDADEVYTPMRARMLLNLAFIGALLIAAGLGVGTIRRRQRIRFLRERLASERHLRALSSRQEALLASLPEIIMEVDQNKVYVWANQPGLDFFGEDVIGKEAAFYFEGEQDTYQKVSPVFNGTEDVIYVESWQRHRDGQKRLLAWWCRTIKDPEGNVTGALSSARDITEERQAEAQTVAALAALRENEAIFDQFMKNSPVYMFFKDENIRALRLSANYKDMLGLPVEEALGKNMDELFPSDLAKSMIADDQRILREGKQVNIEEELNGRFYATIKFPIHVEGKPRYLAGFTIDITERKLAEDQIKAALEALRISLREKELLLQEIHHRVKNNMQIISSLFNLEAEHASLATREILKKGQTRIRSMSLVHERLYRAADLSKIDLAEYIETLAVHLFQVYVVDPRQVRLETDFEEVRLDINSAIPCGLILNELISNALKHAFPGGRKGVINIRLARAAEGTVELLISDNGVGLPDGMDFRNPSSFGFQIIKLLVDQLDAAIDLDRSNGTTFILKFKELKYKPRI
ncbi:MAG: PAS domain S-box protein [Candidatus Aminicenantes bacterium]|nr:PAS domain S-box protein [Candidatus Aminicenantes bacterium]